LSSVTRRAPSASSEFSLCDGAGARPQCALSSIYSRIANKASNLILVPFGLLAEWLKLFASLATVLGPCLSQSCHLGDGYPVLVLALRRPCVFKGLVLVLDLVLGL
jgi:hypothetical protein